MKMRITAIAILVAGLLAAAELKTDIEFARPAGKPLLLDVSVPEGKGPFATVILVHGGGFVRGDKQMYVKPLFEPLTKAGFVWFSVNYRMAEEGRYPLAVDDVDTAIRWVKSHAKQYKVDPRRIALLGESAGAHLVASSVVRQAKGANVKAAVAFYGPHDFEQRARDIPTPSEGMQKFLGVTELNDEGMRKLREQSPYTYVKPGLPPFLLIHGTKDPQVPYNQSVRMCEKLKANGDQCELYTVPDGGHGMGGWEKLPGGDAYKGKLVEWLNAHL